MARRELARILRACVALAAGAVLLAPASADAAAYATRTLATGSSGRDVRLLQVYLTRAGFRTKASGRYGALTARAEKRLERELGLRVDGRATPADQRAARRLARTGGDASTLGTGSGGQAYEGSAGNPTARARLSADHRTAVAPDGAPPAVRNAIAAANRITTKPYRYGGGHGAWEDSSYDCSGSVSYALHGAGLVPRPLDSTAFESWGAAGAGRWISVYANGGHAYAVIAGLRFDTSNQGRGDSGPRWRQQPRSPAGFVARHPAGL